MNQWLKLEWENREEDGGDMFSLIPVLECYALCRITQVVLLGERGRKV